jgi:hypothetical protein
MPYKGGVQLLPETQRRPTLASYTSGNSFFYAAVVIGIAVVVVSAIIGGYKANLRERISALDGAMATSEKARDKTQEQQLIAASKQSSIIKELLSGKLYWTQALALMEQMTQASVALTSMQADAEHSVIAFHAKTDSYASVARQIAAFTAATGIEDISVASIKTGPQGKVEFDGTLTIDTKALLNKRTSTK